MAMPMEAKYVSRLVERHFDNTSKIRSNSIFYFQKLKFKKKTKYWLETSVKLL